MPTRPDRRPFARPGWGGLLGLALLLLCGCPPQRRLLEPRDVQEALARINANAARLAQPVHYQARAGFRFRDDQGRMRRVPAQEAALLFAAPRCLVFQVRSLGGPVAQFGSNDERYWMWIEPEVRKLWWGRWDRLDRTAPQQLPLPPDDLLDVLMLRPLAASAAGGAAPLLRKVNRDYRLLYVRLDADCQPVGLREIVLDPYEPGLPLELVDRLPDGRVQMQAVLANYQSIAAGGPYVPRRYAVQWPLKQAEMRIDVSRAVFRPDLPGDFCTFPAGWEGEVEALDPDNAVPPPEDVP
jgi:hypothetical protein